MALNESGAWRTVTLNDASVWSTLGENPSQISGWSEVCATTLPLLELEQPIFIPPAKIAMASEAELAPPPAPATVKVVASAKRKPKARQTVEFK
jgi:hypothetical protein